MKSTPSVFLSFILTVLLSLSLLAGCGTASATSSAHLAPAAEDRLVIYTSHRDAIYGPIIREFEARTGIWVQVETGGSMELLDRLSQGETDCDVFFGGGVDTLEAHKDLFTPYHSPLAAEILPEYDSEDHAWTPFSSLPIVLAYNSKLVRLNAPSGWKDLLDPTWQGRIAYADPRISSSAFTALYTMLQIYSDTDPEITLERFLQNLDGEILTSSSSVIEQIAHGNCYIGITLEDEAIRSMQDGYDVAMVYPKEGTSAICDGVAIVAGCTHEDNARLFIDFLLQKDVQTYLVESCYRRSVRADLQDLTATSEEAFLPYDIVQASASQSDLLSLWEQLCKEVTP